MTDETIVAVYDTAAHAEGAVAELKRAGVPDHCISVHAEAATPTAPAATAPARPEGFWSNLFGGEPDHDTSVYERSVAGGATVLTVTSCDADLVQVLRILENHHPIDIDERAGAYGLTREAATGPGAMRTDLRPQNGATAATPGVAIPGADAGSETLRLAEENIAVGKRVVNRGSTRIRRFVVERPVEENVTLRDETVTLERRPVTDGRTVSDADFSERTVEMTATGEEAVVTKSARVYEEVGLRKNATERVETVRDTVRKEEVEVQKSDDMAADLAANGRPKLDPRAPKI